MFSTCDGNGNPEAQVYHLQGLIAKPKQCPLLAVCWALLSSVHSFISQPQFLLNLAEHTLCQDLFPCQVSGFKVLPFLSYSVSPLHLHTKLSF